MSELVDNVSDVGWIVQVKNKEILFHSRYFSFFNAFSAICTFPEFTFLLASRASQNSKLLMVRIAEQNITNKILHNF